jgi:cell volume regulation protein A
MPTLELLVLVITSLLLFGIVASRLSNMFGVPALLIFIGVGLFAGDEGLGRIPFYDAQITQFVGVTALAFILFSGGLDSDWKHMRSALRGGLALSTVGVILTAGLVGVFAHLVLGFSPLEGLLLGAIISSTDAAAVFSVLRSRSVRLRRNLEPVLELESGSNDPMAIFLTISLVALIATPDLAPLSLILSFVRQFLLGGLGGYFGGRLIVWIVNHIQLNFDGLYPVLTTTLMLFVYSGVSLLGGNGFLAVYLVGLTMAQADFIHKRSLIRFHDGVAWLMQITMFTLLGLLVTPSQVLAVAGVGLVVSAFLILVARPISTFISLLPVRMPARDMLMIAWVGLRGAAPIILATFPLLAGVERSAEIFNIVFFVVITSVLLQGTTIVPVARLLGVTAAPDELRPALTSPPSEQFQGEMTRLAVPSGSLVIDKQIVQLGIPESALIVMLRRGQQYIIPRGSTSLQANDVLTVLADPESIPALCEMFQLSVVEEQDEARPAPA